MRFIKLIEYRMEEQVQKTERIAKNTLMLYGRMLFSMLVSLYTSRVVLNTLGVEDYGIYNVVGGVVAMFSLLSGSLSAAVSRFLTFELGKNCKERLVQVFSTSLLVHIFLAIFILVCIELVGVWFLNNKMVIPDERMYASNWLLQFSMLNFVVGLISVPYTASIISHERMAVFAYIGITDSVLKLLIVLSLELFPGSWDKLIVYALLLLVISLFFQGIYWYYCVRNFEECRFRFRVEQSVLREITGFAGWNFIGASSAVLRDQGGNILLNMFGGPAINAARGIATSVNVAVCGFVNNFMVAVNPQITKSYATGDYDYMMSLIYRSSRFSFYLLLLLSLPIIFNSQYILALWLGIVPEHVVTFVQLILIFAMCESISNPLVTAMLATGKIRNYQLVVGGLQMMNLPISYLVLKLGAIPESVMMVAIGISISCLIARLFMLRGLIKLSAFDFVKKVIVNVSLVAVVGMLSPLLLSAYNSPTFFDFCVGTIVCLMSVSLSVYFIGCTMEERLFILQKVKQVIQKLR